MSIKVDTRKKAKPIKRYGTCCRQAALIDFGWVRRCMCVGTWVLVVIGAACPIKPVRGQLLDFGRDIRPILVENCFACHGPDAESRQAGLRLDERKAAIELGVIVPGDSAASELVTRIFSDDADVVMPPADSQKSLTREQKEWLQQWIDSGATYQAHWAFVPPQMPPIPKPSDREWPRNNLDRFVLQKLESQGMSPAMEAKLPTLVRRVSLDLTGLPPSPEVLERVLNDPHEDRYERYVDELLSQPQWGEHRTRYWLDYGRYADTHGIHFDNYREIWAYRDWLIDAFNQNMPFDQFTIEQLAGDLLPNPTMEQLIATGFNRCNITTNEGGVIEDEYRVLYARDRVETTSLVWMGLTMGCAVCHDHKYDPFSQREFYQLSAFFNNTTQPVMDGNVHDTRPIIRVPDKADRDRYVSIGNEWNDIAAEIQSRRKSVEPHLQEWLATQSVNPQAAAFTEPLMSEILVHVPLDDHSERELIYAQNNQVRRVSLEPAGKWTEGFTKPWAWVVQNNLRPTMASVGDFERDQSFSISLWVKPASLDGAIVARMEEKADYRGWDVWIQNGFAAMHLIHKWPDNALKVVASERPLQVNRWYHLAITYDGTSSQHGIRIYVDGEPVTTHVEQDSLRDTTRTGVPFRIGSRDNSAILDGTAIQELLVYGRVLSADEITNYRSQQWLGFLSRKTWDHLTEGEKHELADWHLRRQDESYSRLLQRRELLNGEKSEIERRGTIAHVMQERPEPAEDYVLYRGEYTQRRDKVTPSTPGVLPPMADLPRNRLGLAEWLVNRQHPLTARVTVNRFWQELFGQGIVVTAGDFGITGALPSNSDLLDYLAVTFQESGWDVKGLFREIVTSATYRQDSKCSATERLLDPDNQFLSRGPRYRMDAEMVRDYALAASGLLVPTIGGPSVKPYQPSGVWEAVAMPESNTRNYKEDDGEKLYRRSMYTFWKRAAPPASMEVLNAPNREVCTVQRERGNTPLQALVTLNDSQFVEAARALAADILKRRAEHLDNTTESSDQADVFAVQTIARRLVCREFQQEELDVILTSLKKLGAHYTNQPPDADQLLAVGRFPLDDQINRQELAAWTMLVNQLLNLDEVLCK